MKLERIVCSATVALAAAVAPADEYLDPKGLGFDPFVPFDALPQDELYPQNAAFSVSSVAVQFQMMPAEHSGLAFRNFRFEEAE